MHLVSTKFILQVFLLALFALYREMQQPYNMCEAKQPEPVTPIRCLSQGLFLDPLEKDHIV